MQAIIDDGVKAIISITAAVDVLNAGLLRPQQFYFHKHNHAPQPPIQTSNTNYPIKRRAAKIYHQRLMAVPRSAKNTTEANTGHKNLLTNSGENHKRIRH